MRSASAPPRSVSCDGRSPRLLAPPAAVIGWGRPSAVRTASAAALSQNDQSHKDVFMALRASLTWKHTNNCREMSQSAVGGRLALVMFLLSRRQGAEWLSFHLHWGFCAVSTGVKLGFLVPIYFAMTYPGGILCPLAVSVIFTKQWRMLEGIAGVFSHTISTVF